MSLSQRCLSLISAPLREAQSTSVLCRRKTEVNLGKLTGFPEQRDKLAGCGNDVDSAAGPTLQGAAILLKGRIIREYLGGIVENTTGLFVLISPHGRDEVIMNRYHGVMAIGFQQFIPPDNSLCSFGRFAQEPPPVEPFSALRPTTSLCRP
jgi:hypothetical protein